MVIPKTDIFTRVEDGAALPDKNGPYIYAFARKALHSQTTSSTIASIRRAATSFLMCHFSTLF